MRGRGAPGRAARHVLVVGACIAWSLPTLGLAVSSVRPEAALGESGWWQAWRAPRELTLASYRAVISREGLGRSFLNSLAIALPSTALLLVAATSIAYALAWLRLPLRAAILAGFAVLMAVPIQMTLIPVLRLLGALGLVGTFPAAWLSHAAYGLPFAVLLLHAAFASVPRELVEAARLEGASHGQALRAVVLPLSAPTLAALAIFQFLWVYNDLLVALVYVGGAPDVAPLTVTLSGMVSALGTEWTVLPAAAMVTAFLPLVVFLALHRHLERAVLAGALKG